MANSIDSDQMLQNAASDLDLYCLQRPVCPNTLGYYSKYQMAWVTIWRQKKNNKKTVCGWLNYRTEPNYSTVRLGVSKLLGKLVVKYVST